MWLSYLVIVCTMIGQVRVKYPGEEKYDMGSLEGDVQNWAMLIQNYILQVGELAVDCL